MCKLHTDVAVAKVNIQFQQISFSPGGCSALLPPSSLGTNVCTTFVAQERRGLPRRHPPSKYLECRGQFRLESAIKLSEMKKVPQYFALLLCLPCARAWRFLCIFTTHVPPTQTKQADIHPLHTQRATAIESFLVIVTTRGNLTAALCFIYGISGYITYT